MYDLSSNHTRCWLGFAVLLIIALAAGLGSSTTANAHGGGLAADGCHTDRSSGTRHCHRDAAGNRLNPPVPATQSFPAAQSNTPASNANGGCPRYNRDEWNYRSIRFNTAVGFYSGQACPNMNTDHVVSLKDAHDSGGCYWSAAEKRAFANDLDNLVPSCARINQAKSWYPPARFIRLANDGRGVEFTFSFAKQCEFIRRYALVKQKYRLSFSINDSRTFAACGVTL